MDAMASNIEGQDGIRGRCMANVEIYTKFTCPYCARAKALLKDKGADFTEYDITMSGKMRTEMLARAPGRTTVPQIFIDGLHIGGCDDMIALEVDGRLDPLLATA